MDEGELQRNQVRSIAEELGFDYRIGENRRLHGAAYSNAVLTRLPIVAQHNHDITRRKDEPRGVPGSDPRIRRSTAECASLANLQRAFGHRLFERRYQARG